MLLGGHFDDAASGLVGDFVRDVRAPALARIVHQQEVYDRIGALGGFDGFVDSDLAAKIFRVGDNHQSFAARFSGQFFPASHPNRVVHVRSVGAGRQGAGRHHGSGSVDLRAVNGAVKLGSIFGKVGKQVHVEIKRENHSLVTFTKDLVQETGGGILLRGQAILFTAAGINEEP